MSQPIKIAHLTSVHKDGDVRIFHKECVSLAEHGYEVSLIIPNSVSRIEKGVKIISFPSKLRFRFMRVIRTVNKVYKKAVEINADVYHLHDPELLRIALKLKRRGKKVIYDAHEDLPRQILGKRYLPSVFRGFISRLVEIVENKKVRKIDGVVAATPFIRDRFLKINSNAIDVNNFPIVNELLIDFDYHKKSERIICYVGGISEIRGIKELTDAIEKIDVKLILAGQFDGVDIETEIKNKPSWSKVDFRGFVNRDDVVSIYKQAQAGIVTLHPLINYLDALPVKMFEYMAAGVPVVASDFPLWKKIVVDGNCGVCVDPLDTNSIAEGIMKILSDPERARVMSENGKQLIKEVYNWDIEKKKLVDFYRKLN